MKSFRDVVALWGMGLAGADALAHATGLGKYAVRNWRARDNIPGEYWLTVIEAARKVRPRVRLELKDLAQIANGKLAKAA